MQHIHTQEEDGTSEATPTGTKELVAKVKALEKDMYYYRRTSRDLRKKLLSASSVTAGGRGSGISVGVAEEGVNSAPEMEGGKVGGRARARVKSKRRKDPETTGKEAESGHGGGGMLARHQNTGSGGKLVGNKDIELGAPAIGTGKNGRNLAGMGPSSPTRKEEQIQEAVSIHVHPAGIRGGSEQSPLKNGGPTDRVGVGSLKAAGGALLQVTGLAKEQQVVKRSRKELRQLW